MLNLSQTMIGMFFICTWQQSAKRCAGLTLTHSPPLQLRAVQGVQASGVSPDLSPRCSNSIQNSCRLCRSLWWGLGVYDIVTEVLHQERFEVGADPSFLLLLLSFATDFA